MLDRNELIVQFTRFVLGLGEQLIEAAGDVDLISRCTGRAANFWQAFQLLLDTPFETVRVYVGLGENGCGQSALLFEQRGEQVLHVDLLMAVAHGFGLRGTQRLLHFFGETIDVHGNALVLRIHDLLRHCSTSRCSVVSRSRRSRITAIPARFAPRSRRSRSIMRSRAMQAVSKSHCVPVRAMGSSRPYSTKYSMRDGCTPAHAARASSVNCSRSMRPRVIGARGSLIAVYPFISSRGLKRDAAASCSNKARSLSVSVGGLTNFSRTY